MASALTVALSLAFVAVLLLALAVPTAFVAWMWALAAGLLVAATTCAVVAYARRK
ncbi:hypothetical protein [Leifsonia aquatica]|uniref:Uncharacterized protein n=2 Tax=Leifsonia aquatica TaxID=144185 RepID=U2R469_LEIAQ|nr:hypothetical protein [Leifsonia aquatica]ERK70050.1 hypothetical protein N136_03621 [Leifsonia aquatica ATCC 14665]MBB2968288.1 hypothetical protein [Leifsonia aquatica]